MSSGTSSTDPKVIQGGLHVKTENGYHLVIYPRRLACLAEIPVTDTRAIGRFWCYATFEAAALAAAVWKIDPDTEPVGWVRSGGARV